MAIVSQVRRHGAAAWRHRWKALALAWAVCALGWIGVSMVPDRYRAAARVYVDADAVLGNLLRGIAVDSSPERQVDLLQRTLLSRPNLEQVVARTELAARGTDEAARAAIAGRLATEIRLVPQTRNLFTLEYFDGSPTAAHAVVRTTLDLLIEAAAGVDRQQMENAQGFLVQQIAGYEVRLREAERRRAEFQARYVEILPDPNGGASRLEAARAGLQAARGELQDARTRRELVQQQLNAQPPMVVAGTEGGGGGGGGSTEAQRTLRELRLRYTDSHPDVRAAQAAVAAGVGGGGGARPSAPRNVMRPNPLHEALRMRMVDAEAGLASLERQVRDGEAELERLDAMAREQPELQAQFTNLDRDYNVVRRNYEELLARRESIQIADAARTGSERVKLEVVDPPSVPTAPASPNRPLLYAAVLVVGAGLGGVLAILLAHLDTGFLTVHDLRRLQLPVLGRISAPRPRLAPRFLSGAAFAVACALLILAFGAVIAEPALLAGLPALIGGAPA